MIRFRLFLAAMMVVATSALAATAHHYTVGQIEISHPFTRAMIPGAKVGGGFMTITNNGSEDDRLISATSPAAPMVQLHQMSMEGDVMKMSQIEGGIVIPAGQTVKLEPGKLHVMFMKVSTPFKEGETVKATLVFEKAGSVEVEFKIGPPHGG